MTCTRFYGVFSVARHHCSWGRRKICISMTRSNSSAAVQLRSSRNYQRLTERIIWSSVLGWRGGGKRGISVPTVPNWIYTFHAEIVTNQTNVESIEFKVLYYNPRWIIRVRAPGLSGRFAKRLNLCNMTFSSSINLSQRYNIRKSNYENVSVNTRFAVSRPNKNKSRINSVS